MKIYLFLFFVMPFLFSADVDKRLSGEMEFDIELWKNQEGFVCPIVFSGAWYWGKKDEVAEDLVQGRVAMCPGPVWDALGKEMADKIADRLSVIYAAGSSKEHVLIVPLMRAAAKLMQPVYNVLKQRFGAAPFFDPFAQNRRLDAAPQLGTGKVFAPVQTPVREGVKHVIFIDDVVKSGGTMAHAVEEIREICPSIRTVDVYTLFSMATLNPSQYTMMGGQKITLSPSSSFESKFYEFFMYMNILGVEVQAHAMRKIEARGTTVWLATHGETAVTYEERDKVSLLYDVVHSVHGSSVFHGSIRLIWMPIIAVFDERSGEKNLEVFVDDALRVTNDYSDLLRYEMTLKIASKEHKRTAEAIHDLLPKDLIRMPGAFGAPYFSVNVLQNGDVYFVDSNSFEKELAAVNAKIRKQPEISEKDVVGDEVLVVVPLMKGFEEIRPFIADCIEKEGYKVHLLPELTGEAHKRISLWPKVVYGRTHNGYVSV